MEGYFATKKREARDKGQSFERPLESLDSTYCERQPEWINAKVETTQQRVKDTYSWDDLMSILQYYWLRVIKLHTTVEGYHGPKSSKSAEQLPQRGRQRPDDDDGQSEGAPSYKKHRKKDQKNDRRDFNPPAQRKTDNATGEHAPRSVISAEIAILRGIAITTIIRTAIRAANPGRKARDTLSGRSIATVWPPCMTPRASLSRRSTRFRKGGHWRPIPSRSGSRTRSAT